MDPLQPAVSRPSFRFRADLLASPRTRRSALTVMTPQTPPAVSYRKLLGRVHNPELRKTIVTEHKAAVARAKLAAMPCPPPQDRRMQTPPTPDISGEWDYYQSGQAREKRRLELYGAQAREPPLQQPGRVPMSVPTAATARLQARDVARAFDAAHAARDYWSQPARKPALNPPPRILSDAERRILAADDSGRQQTVTKQTLSLHLWQARW